MSVTNIRLTKIEELGRLAQTEAEKDIVIKAAMKICDAENDELACEIAETYRENLLNISK